ncbi:MAG: type 1 glutamine amidotransferase domain-containing protein [Planctomycetota bacterium]
MILIPLPQKDFDPSEVCVSWKMLTDAGHSVVFATPTGQKALADERMITGRRLLFWSPFLRADRRARECYGALSVSPEFLNPKKYSEVIEADFQGILLPGGHAPGMKEYLESEILQKRIAEFFENDKPVGAICHGVLLVARSQSQKTGKSVLYGRKTTTLLKNMELTAWLMTCLWLKNYYRTYPTPTQTEVTACLKNPEDFQTGPLPIFRDTPEKKQRGFVVRDGNYVSARWPGDVHRFASEFLELLKTPASLSTPRTGML